MTIRYDIGGWPTVSGARNPLVVLDPEQRRVYTFGHVGAGTPEPVFHGRHQVLGSVSVQAVPSELHAQLEAMESQIEAIASRYRGSQWNGQNHVGVWDTGPDGDLFEELIAFDELLRDVPCYADAGDVIGEDVVDALIEGRSLAEVVASEVETSRYAGLWLEPDDVEQAIRQLVHDEMGELASDLEEEGGTCDRCGGRLPDEDSSAWEEPVREDGHCTGHLAAGGWCGAFDPRLGAEGEKRLRLRALEALNL